MGSYRINSFARKLKSPVTSPRSSASRRGSVNKNFVKSTIRIEYARARAQVRRSEGRSFDHDSAIRGMDIVKTPISLCDEVEKVKLEKFPEYDEGIATRLLHEPEVFTMPVGPPVDLEDYEFIFNRAPQLATFTGRLPPGLEVQIKKRHAVHVLKQQFPNYCGAIVAWNAYGEPLFDASTVHVMSPFGDRMIDRSYGVHV